MDIRCFFQALKAQSLSGTYLLCGEEEFLKDQALSACVQQIDPVARELNLEYLDAGTLDDVDVYKRQGRYRWKTWKTTTCTRNTMR